MCEESRSNDFAHAKDVAPDEIINRYTEWARQGNYEKHLNPEIYRGPQLIADHITDLFPVSLERKKLRVLDVAAGTGFVGEKLWALGFENIDALEPSIGMADILKSKNIYSQVFLTPLYDEQPAVELGVGSPEARHLPGEQEVHASSIRDYVPHSYDLLIVCGGMGENHIPCAALEHMIRLVKSGGVIVIMMREAYLTTVDEYRDRLEPRMKTLENGGKWTMLSRSVVPRYSFENNGVLFTFRVL